MSNKSTKRLEKVRLERENRKKINLIVGIVVAVVVVALIGTFAYLNFPKAAAPTPTPASAAAQGTPAPAAQDVTPPGGAKQQWSSPPPMTIDKTKQYFATVKMAKGGEFVIQLFPDKAPITVNSFVFLARQGFFNGLTFHRVLDGFMAQGGDPTGMGNGGPGYEFVNEVSDLKFDKAGVVAMANSGPNTNGSQFFIMFGPYSLSENDYTIFGQVISGM
ncbi:MAG: peptidylprolyl isomerase, partial [Anaerolineales bacterium]